MVEIPPNQPSIVQTSQQPQMRHIDRPEIREVFVDGVWGAYFDGANVRVEFTVNRLDDVKLSVPPSGTMSTAARLVLPVAGLMQAMQHFNQLITSLQQQGILRQVQIQNPPTSGQPH